MVDIEQSLQVFITALPGIGMLVGMAIIYFVYNRYSFVQKTFGWNFIKTLGRTKQSLSKGYILLRVIHPSGGEEYFTTKVDTIINYSIKMRDKNIKKYVIYDPKMVNYVGNIPVLNVNPNDIRPINYKSGQMIAIPSEIVFKLATDASKKQEEKEKFEKLVKYVLIGGVVMGIILLLSMSYMNEQVLACAADLRSQLMIVGG